MNDKLKEIGQRLDIDEKDIKNIKKEKRWENVKKTIIGLILSLLILSNLSILLKMLLEAGSSTSSSYPYGVAVLPSILVVRDKESVSPVIATILMLSITLLLFSTLFLMIPAYGVFSKTKRDDRDELSIR